MSRFWKFINSADEESAELLLYGPISETSWWGDEVTPAQFNSDLAALGEIKTLKVRINSPGGDVFAAAAIHNSLKNHAARVEAYVDGWAASAASVVAMAGDEVIMPATSMMMIHNPASFVFGDARDMRATADVLDKVRDSIIAAYEAKTGKPRAELINLMNSETWMTAKDAVELGFADRIDEQATVQASMRGRAMIVNGVGFDLGKFKTVPTPYLNEVILPAFAGVDNTGCEPAEITESEVPTMADTQTTETVEEPVVEQAATDEAGEQAEEITDTAEQTVDPVADERARIQAIRKLSKPGLEAVIDAAIDEGLSPEATALRILESDEFKNSQARLARATDAGAVDGVSAGGGTPQALTKEIIANMTPDEMDARMPEIIAFHKAQKGK